ECLDVDTSTDPSIDEEDAADTIAWSRTRTERIVDNTLSRLDAAGEIEYDSIDVHAAVQVTCDRCGRTTSIRSFLETGGCSCAES
ncbi:MAG: rod-determining factor RdfA, partial [Halanaeroarchaeum sp.]